MGDIVYYSASLVNSAVKEQKDCPLCIFNETRASPLITDASQYWFTVVRFTANGVGRQLPIWMPQIQLGSDPDLTVYSVTLNWQYSGLNGCLADPQPVTSPVFTRRVYFQYIPEDKTLPKPQPPRTKVETDPYYYVTQYATFVEMANNALESAFFEPGGLDAVAPPQSLTLQSQLGRWWTSQGYTVATTPRIPEADVPRLLYDKASGLFSYRLSASYMETDRSTELYMNEALWNLLAHMHTEFVGKSLGRDYRVIVSKYLDASTTGEYIVSQDRISTDNLWSPIGEFSFSTTLLPTVAEQQGPPVIYGANNLTSGVVSGFQNQFTDTIPFPSRADTATSFIYYAPSSQYRLIDMGQKQHFSN